MSDAVWLALIVGAGTAFTAWLNYKLNTKTDGKLGQIHELVNSNMSAQIQDTLDYAKAQLVTLDQLMALQKVDGKTMSKDALAVRQSLARRVVELEKRVDDRAKQTVIADAKLV
jgi:hypothetical protein